MGLISAIAVELVLDQSQNFFDVWYIVEGNSSLMIIKNDNDVKIYVKLSKSVPKFVMYPSCMPPIDKSSKELEFDDETKIVVCVQGMKSDACSYVVESQNEYSLYIPEFEVKNFIIDIKNIEVEVKQL